MITVRKTIRRRSAASALRAMKKHAQRMKARGWIEGATFAGDAFLNYEVRTYFERGNKPDASGQSVGIAPTEVASC